MSLHVANDHTARLLYEMSEPEQKPSPEDSAARFPGVAAIALWMLLESLIGVFGVLTGHFASHGASIAVLAVATLLALAGLGLLKMQPLGMGAGLGRRIPHQQLRHLHHPAIS